MRLKIVQAGEPVLRQTAVHQFEVAKVSKLLDSFLCLPLGVNCGSARHDKKEQSAQSNWFPYFHWSILLHE
jgi:hypothetical protein